MKLARFAPLALLLACKPGSGSGDTKASSEPPVIVEPPSSNGPQCRLVTTSDNAFEISEHTDWLDLWNDRELASEGEEDSPTTPAQARERMCVMTSGSTDDAIGCTNSGRQILAIPVEYEQSILIVEEREGGLRSLELSRWGQTMCRCGCGNSVELLGRDPLRVVVAEWESMPTEVHSEGDEIIEGCDEDDECQTACLGDVYGHQRLLEFGDSLDVHANFVDESATDEGEFEVRFALEAGRLIASGHCTQVLSD